MRSLQAVTDSQGYGAGAANAPSEWRLSCDGFSGQSSTSSTKNREPGWAFAI